MTPENETKENETNPQTSENETARLSSFDLARQPRLTTFGKGYTSFIRALRFALPVLALVLVGIVAARLSFDKNQQQRVTQLPEKGQTTAGQSEMAAPRFESHDGAGNKYVVTADAAARDVNNPDSIALTRPSGTLELEGDKALTAEATGGLFDTRAQTLSLTDGVSLSYGDGTQLKTTRLSISLKDKAATAEGPVTIEGGQTTIQGTGLTTAENGNIVTLGGPVRVTLTPGSGAKARP